MMQFYGNQIRSYSRLYKRNLSSDICGKTTLIWRSALLRHSFQDALLSVILIGDIIITSGRTAAGRDESAVQPVHQCIRRASIEVAAALVQKEMLHLNVDQRMFRRKEGNASIIKKCNDLAPAAGVCCCHRRRLAADLRINLDKVRKICGGLDGTEIAISSLRSVWRLLLIKRCKTSSLDLQMKKTWRQFRLLLLQKSRDLYLERQRNRKYFDAFLDTNGAHKKP